MLWTNVLTGHRLMHCENHLESSMEMRASSRGPSSFRPLESFAADGVRHEVDRATPLNRAFLVDSLQKISDPSFRPGITPARLNLYRDTLQHMQIRNVTFAEGRRRLIEILREDWIEKCEEMGIEVKRLKLSEYVALLRSHRQKVASWVDAFIAESETNAALEVISLTSYGFGNLEHDDALLRMEEENYLGLHFGGSTDQKLITEPLGFSPGALSHSMDELAAQKPEWRRFFLPEELILRSAGRAHSHIAPGLHVFADFCNLDQVRESRVEDAWVLHLSPEENVRFHDGRFHPYLAIVHDIHIHWNYLNGFSPAVRMEKVRAFDHIRRERMRLDERQRAKFKDSVIAEVLEGLRDHQEVRTALENSRL